MSNLAKLKQLTTELQGKLIAEEKALRALSDNINDGFFDYNLKTQVEYMSPRFWEILGQDPNLKKDCPSEWKALIHPEDLKIIEKDFAEKLATQDIFRWVVRYPCTCGQPDSWMKIKAAVQVITRDDQDQAERMIGTHTLISTCHSSEGYDERKQSK